MSITTLLTFSIAFFVFAASPGPDNLAIVARTISNGARAGLAYGAGTVMGILIYLSVAAFGLSVMAAKMTVMMEVLRYGGASYLIWMGVRLWMAQPVIQDPAGVGEIHGVLSAFLTGTALNLGNPKMPLFYVALLPNVVGTSLSPFQVGELACTIVAVEIVVIGGHIILATRARRYLRTPRFVQKVNRGAGGLMVGAGVAVMTTR